MTGPAPGPREGVGLVAAVRILTRVPVPGADLPYSRAVPWFPIVGMMIGAVVGGLAAIGSNLSTPMVGASLGVIGGMVLTGAFHEDGLADVADAFVGGWHVEQRLEILKDPRHGTYGVAALCSTVILRIAVLAALLAGAGAAGTVAAAAVAHGLARCGAVVVLAVVPSAQPTKEGLAVRSRQELSRPAVALGVASCLVVSAVFVGSWLPPALLAVVVISAAVARFAWNKIGGVVGDVLGTIEQLGEGAALLTFAVLAERWPLWWT